MTCILTTDLSGTLQMSMFRMKWIFCLLVWCRIVESHLSIFFVEGVTVDASRGLRITVYCRQWAINL